MKNFMMKLSSVMLGCVILFGSTTLNGSKAKPPIPITIINLTSIPLQTMIFNRKNGQEYPIGEKIPAGQTATINIPSNTPDASLVDASDYTEKPATACYYRVKIYPTPNKTYTIRELNVINLSSQEK